MSRYRDARTGKFISIGSARALGKVIYKIDSEGKERISKNFRPPPKFTGLRIRDIKTGKYIDEKKAAGKWVSLEKWKGGSRLEVGKKNRYSSDEIEKIKKRLEGVGGAGGGEYLGLLEQEQKLRERWGRWGSTSEKAIIVTQSTNNINAMFRESLNAKEKKQFDENKDLIDNLVLKYIAENTTEEDIDAMSFEEYKDFIDGYLGEIRDNLDDLEMFSIPF